MLTNETPSQFRVKKPRNLARGTGSNIPWQCEEAGSARDLASGEAENWGMALRDDGHGTLTLVLKSAVTAQAVLARNVWGEPVCGASIAMIVNATSTVFPLDRKVQVNALFDQLCLQVPSSSPLFYARLIEGHGNRGTANAKLQINSAGVVTLVALGNSIEAGIPLSIATPIVEDVSPPPLQVQSPSPPFVPERFVRHLRMFKVMNPSTCFNSLM
jgi:hypothetical protein